MKKVVLLGAFGAQAWPCVTDLAAADEVTQLVLVDRTIDRDKLQESGVTSSKVSIEAIDVADFDNLVSLIKGSDVVVNFVGPYWKYGIQTIKAAIAAGTNYLDICDDHDVVSEALGLDKAAKDRGVTVCIGYGASPGRSNLLAKYFAQQLDEVDEISYFWALGLGQEMGPAALSHIAHMYSGNVPQYIDNELVYVPAGSGIEQFEVSGITATVAYVGHPEPVTLPRYIRGVKTAIIKGGILPAWCTQMFLEFAERGFTGTEPLRIGDAFVSPRDCITSVVANSPTFRGLVDRQTESISRLTVKGREAGAEVTYSVSRAGRGGMTVRTGVAASICTKMLLREEITAKGVLPPEAVVDPRLFFAEYDKTGFVEEKVVTRPFRV